MTIYIYIYDHANLLTGVSAPGKTANFTYNGLGDRLQQTVNNTTQNYTLDLVVGLTQVLSDGQNSYVYGNGRIAHYTGTTPLYFLGDALASVRQLIDNSGSVVLAKGYEPYGYVLDSAGTSSTVYGFRGDFTDLSEAILQHQVIPYNF